MRTQSAYQRVVETTRTEYTGGPRMPRRENYDADDCRYARVIQMIRAGKTVGEIVYEYPEFFNQIDVLAIYRKIADGSISRGRVITSNATRTSDGRRTRCWRCT